jgi:hypothetical protein
MIATFLYYGHGGGGGLSEVGRVIAHAVIWTVTSQVVRSVPGLGGLLMFAVAGGWLIWRRRRRPVRYTLGRADGTQTHVRRWP